MKAGIIPTKLVWLGCEIPPQISLDMSLDRLLIPVLNKYDGTFVVQKMLHITILPPIKVTEQELEQLILAIRDAVSRYLLNCVNQITSLTGLYFEDGGRILGKNAVALVINTSASNWNLLMNALIHQLAQSVYAKTNSDTITTTLAHVTLGRIKPPHLAHLPEIEKIVATIPAPYSGGRDNPFIINQLTLYESLGEGEYDRLCSFLL